jgi:hypothetical protein
MAALVFEMTIRASRKNRMKSRAETLTLDGADVTAVSDACRSATGRRWGPKFWGFRGR